MIISCISAMTRTDIAFPLGMCRSLAIGDNRYRETKVVRV